MNFPVWDLGFAHAILIAAVAIFHVYISHFAVGGGLFLVLTETLARRRQDDGLLDYLHGHARFFILITLVLGAISGVGIWFTIGLINPAGTSALIHAFVWGWAIEWTFFFTEIAAAMIYYYGWKSLSPRVHLTVGWIYFGAAWLSMVVINGILSFQLTPGEWLTTRGFWDGFFNPTYWSSLFVRTAFAVSLAGLFALITAARMRDGSLRAWLIRYSGIWAAVGLAGCAALTLWWWGAVPEEIRGLTRGDMPFASMVTQWLPVALSVLAALVLLGPLAMPKLVRTPVAFVILIVGFVLMGGGEWIRESVRKPWVVYGYLYSNGVLADEVGEVESIVAHAKWIDPRTHDDPVALGEELFVVACGNCHAREGYNGLRSRTAYWDEEYTAAFVQRLEYTRRPMPPWIGDENEAQALAAYLMTLKHPAQPPPAMDGEAVFARSCASCHAIDGMRSLRDLLEGLEAADLDEFMQDMESDEMPPFTATDAEREALADWLAEQVNAPVEDEVAVVTTSEGGTR